MNDGFNYSELFFVLVVLIRTLNWRGKPCHQMFIKLKFVMQCCIRTIVTPK